MIFLDREFSFVTDETCKNLTVYFAVVSNTMIYYIDPKTLLQYNIIIYTDRGREIVVFRALQLHILSSCQSRY